MMASALEQTGEPYTVSTSYHLRYVLGAYA